MPIDRRRLPRPKAASRAKSHQNREGVLSRGRVHAIEHVAPAKSRAKRAAKEMPKHGRPGAHALPNRGDVGGLGRERWGYSPAANKSHGNMVAEMPVEAL